MYKDRADRAARGAVAERYKREEQQKRTNVKRDYASGELFLSQLELSLQLNLHCLGRMHRGSGLRLAVTGTFSYINRGTNTTTQTEVAMISKQTEDREGKR